MERRPHAVFIVRPLHLFEVIVNVEVGGSQSLVELDGDT